MTPARLTGLDPEGMDLLAGDRPLDEHERRHFAGRIVEAANDLRRLLDEAAA